MTMARKILVVGWVGVLSACSASGGAPASHAPAGSDAGPGGAPGVAGMPAAASIVAGAGGNTPIATDAGTAGVPTGSAGRATGSAGRAQGSAGQGGAVAGQAAAAGAASVATLTPISTPAPKPSAGCGMPAPMSGMATIDVMGTSRAYIMTLPQNYDASKPYKLIFAWHGLGGTAQQVASNWYGLSQRAQGSAIFVAGQGLETSNSVGSGPGWPNTNGQDVAFVKALYAQLQGQVCFDQNRVFSVGMSYGGIMSITLGCSMGDVFRAIAPMSGAGPGFGGRATCIGQVAVWQSHGDMDTTVATSSGEASRDFWVKANHCQMPAMPVDPTPCVEYPGCDADKPVTFCEFSGGHTIPSFAPAAIWTFFAQF